MSDLARLGIDIDTGGVTAATEALNRLAEAAQRAADALGNLEEENHGGIIIKVVGPMVHIEIKPPKS